MEPVQALRHSISHFAFTPLPTASSLRRSSCRSVPVKDGITYQLQEDLEPGIQSKGKRLEDALELVGSSPKKKRRVSKRGYADPETYIHLNGLSDHLAPSLDVLFCGINPGCMSATKGHHYANPTNHFWKCLHLSGFTPRLLSPSEDATIPICYSLGLTNLVERPSTEQAELSKEEMKQSVPSLTAKITNNRPLIVCFVGKGIWTIVEAVFKKQVRETGANPSRNNKKAENMIQQDVGEFPLMSSSTHKVESPNGRIARRPAAVLKTFDWGLQPYKFVYPDTTATVTNEKLDDSAFLVPGSRANATLFFVMPSTSGRVVSHQLADKVKLFSRLRDDLGRIKARKLDTSGITIVPLRI